MYLRIQINTTLELQTHNLNPKYKIIQGRREGRLSSYHPNSRKRKTSPPDALVLPHLVVGLLFPAQWHSSLHRGDAHGLRHSRGPFFTLRQQTRQEAPSSLKRVRSASLAAGHITEGEKKNLKETVTLSISSTACVNAIMFLKNTTVISLLTSFSQGVKPVPGQLATGHVRSLPSSQIYVKQLSLSNH